ncbi:hypothetical protein [Rhodopirellula halodulae]|uniref:hypothetical protein n=1 Tax=Rhodopirellula halodulae TaxID=2894198 RepID=UPI001E5E9442|nr:hypothetical protein [Rhodopirellula sp. JC737]MCC9654894.1 hypothetical protein [Rhodopirellula sp. JC737]
MPDDWDDEPDEWDADTYSEEWDDDDYEEFLSREFPDSTERQSWAGGRRLWHWTVWVLVIVFVGGYLLALM